MAIIENGYLKGQIGNLVNRKVGDKNVVQAKSSDKMRQTRWTEAAASDFGTASAAGAIIRRAFNTVHQKIHDGGMHNRLVRRMQRVLLGYGKHNAGYQRVSQGNIQRLVGFQFNKNCHLYDYLYFDTNVTFAATGAISILIPELKPEQNFYWPKACSHIILKFEIIGLSFAKRCTQTIGSHETELTRYDNQQHKARTLTFDSPDKDYDTILVSLSTLYLEKRGRYAVLLNSIDLNPAGIIAAHNLRNS
ncbi:MULTISPECIES: hypothetical protein [unclassified Sphingobacterium]|uniref:hypothetical protein n=1 Tax=unclassified Sphingobacterium TaxID=2609468 RepID=UPI0025E32435|nr:MULTISPECIES: hypothetical protein [unclassified Sphingobacterium]